MPTRRLVPLDLDPSHWAMVSLRVTGRAFSRLWGRDVMLYVGGVSFFALLAVFPALAILIGIYSLLAAPGEAERTAEAFAHLMPPVAQTLFESELVRLAKTPLQAISTQSGLAAIIGIYAAHRGFKALLAGLSFIHEEEDQRGFVGFNVMALLVLLAAFAMLILISSVFLALRVAAVSFNLRPLAGVNWFFSEWTWASVGMTLGLALIYRFAMSRAPVDWRASIIGGAMAALMFMGASWASAFYVEQIAHLGATYGSLAAVVVFLIWLSWNVNAVFFGGALATEVELALHVHAEQKLLEDLRGEKPRPAAAP